MSEVQATILVVDDSPITLEVVSEVLGEQGYRVETIDEPLECREKIAELRPDVLVLDITMPALDGPSLLRLIHEDRRHDCPVLLFSDRSRSELTATIRACGADGGAVKTPDCGELVEVIGSVLASRRRARASQSSSP
ncbi:response regulator [Pseudenhygromyxa sp. WMMC2535]|uniref:response regulator n=1 Tax=Pseudenhygromyxa sp. WMMC2535 TaxID=2712867 RepID=UPI00155249C8|nr:response regulator [Pseudenhygromyxa sp. WMMC2535]NVB39122.1 response regulator [Pseudenhygromyxa sp. WMMC2535]